MITSWNTDFFFLFFFLMTLIQSNQTCTNSNINMLVLIVVHGTWSEEWAQPQRTLPFLYFSWPSLSALRIYLLSSRYSVYSIHLPYAQDHRTMYFSILLPAVAAVIFVVDLVEARAVFAHYMVCISSWKANAGKPIHNRTEISPGWKYTRGSHTQGYRRRSCARHRWLCT